MSSDSNYENYSTAEYEAQHYGFSSSKFLHDFRTEISDTIKEIHNVMQKNIVKHLNLNEDKQKILCNEIANLTNLYEEVADKSFRTHEADVKKFFAIPENVLLENDKIHENDSMENIQDLENEIECLEKEYLKEKCLLAIYQQDMANFKKIEALQQNVKLKLKQTKKIPELFKQVNDMNVLSKRYEQVVIRLESDCELKIRSKMNKLKHKYKFKNTEHWTPFTS